MTSTILLTGGTGTLGRLVTPLLLDAGAKPRVLSRRPHESADSVEYVTGDLLEDQGLEPAVDGAEIVLHLAGGPKGDDVATRNLMRAAARAEVRHVVYISVIGADRVPVAWLRSKLGAEQAVAGSGVPWTTLRAAQFHDLALTVVAKLAKLPVIPVPGGLRFQPVDARDVAARARGADPRRAGRPRARPGGTDGLRAERAGRRVPARPWQAPPAAAGPDAREGRPRVPGRREPDARRSGPRHADLGGVPGRTSALTPHPFEFDRDRYGRAMLSTPTTDVDARAAIR
jgi:uncharacterized protein YbjT (DUF2867 family)